jgi:hypothetical protein
MLYIWVIRPTGEVDFLDILPVKQGSGILDTSFQLATGVVLRSIRVRLESWQCPIPTISLGLKNINNTFDFASRLDFHHCPSVFPYYWISPGFNSK